MEHTHFTEGGEHCNHSHHHCHSHSHKLDNTNEKKTLFVVVFTLITMFVEIFYGYISNSMALLADGWHMGTHAFALGIALGAYIFIRKISHKSGSTVVSKKVSALAGFTSSLFLLLMALSVLAESVERFIMPKQISFDEAIAIAIIGLIVNLICVFVMEYKNNKSNDDTNYKAAYIHILTDAITSIFAIIALFAGKLFGLYMLDPIMGIVGGVLILKWGISLVKETSTVLLDLKLLSDEV